jgi:hypothetical protein
MASAAGSVSATRSAKGYSSRSDVRCGNHSLSQYPRRPLLRLNAFAPCIQRRVIAWISQLPAIMPSKELVHPQ